MRIHVILRTHDIKNVHDDWRIRYCDLDKHTLVKGCFESLLNTIRHVKDHEVKLTVLDDHSTDPLIDFLKQKQEEHPFELIHNEERGYRYSAVKQFEMARDSDCDLVYNVEDDYLHTETALQEMIDSYLIFTSKIQDKLILLYPFDAPEVYDPPKEPDFVVHGSNRHWRTGYFCTNVMMAPPILWQRYWEQFHYLGANYDGNYIRKRKETEPRVHESNTIWPIWQSGQALRFNPIPSLALHMQFDQQLDPFIDWESWWTKYTTQPLPEE